MAEGDCRARLERLFDYLDGELDPRKSDALERHLDDCHCCGELADSLKRTIAVCRDAGHPHIPKAVQSRAKARVRALLSGKSGMSARQAKRRARASG